MNTSSANIVYPLDNVVMPQNVFPADIQWANGAAGDVFRVTLRKSLITVTALVLHTGAGFKNDWLVDQAAWRALAQTNPDESATLTVDRWVAASSLAVASAPVHLKFARAAVSGTVYYWSVSEARVFKVNDGTNTRVNFMPNPPVVNGPGGSDICVGCHTISPSGRYLVARFAGGQNFGSVYDLTTDLTANPPAGLFSTDKTMFWFSTWNPSETRLVVTQGPNPTGLSLMNPMTGDILPAGGNGLPATDATHPSWSPDGTTLAYVSNAGDWGVDMKTGDLSLIPVLASDQFGAPSTIVTGASVPNAPAGQQAVSYPVWAPDSKRLVFALGETARSAASRTQLYIVNKDGSGLVALTKANNGNERLSYEPRFSPFDSGGYYWLAYLSRRPYGNALAGSAGSPHEQVWVTAIKKNAQPGEDPSEVGYWLPGQLPTSRSISAYWAPRACRATGAGCAVDTECCSGDCRPPVSGGATVCSPPPPERCRNEGETCGGSGECCNGLKCDNAVCQVQIN